MEHAHGLHAQVADLGDMWMALTAAGGGEYHFLGCVGWFNHEKFATSGVFPVLKGAQALQSAHFPNEEQNLNFPVALRVSVPKCGDQAELQKFWDARGWQCDNADMMRMAFFLAVQQAAEANDQRYLTRLKKRSKNIMAPSLPQCFGFAADMPPTLRPDGRQHQRSQHQM
jgi:hypothetical protein